MLPTVARESLTHFSECTIVGQVFRAFRTLTGTHPSNVTDKHRHTLFAIKPDGGIEDEGWVNLHLLLWKHVIFSLVQVDTEDVAFTQHGVWQPTWYRLEKKALALSERAKAVIRRAANRGEQTPDVTNRGDPLKPIARIDATGHLVWNDEIVKKLKSLGDKLT